jgi:hypothetical protein
MSFGFANDADYAKLLIKSGWNVVAIGTDANWFAATVSKVLTDLKRAEI